MGKLHFPYRHDFYHLLLLTKGGGSFSIDFQNFRIKPFQFYFMIPGQVHSWSFEGDMDGYVINFSVPFFRSFLLNADYLDQFSFFSGHVNESVIEIPADLQPSMIALLEMTVKETESMHQFKSDTIRVMLLHLFLMIGNIAPKYGAADFS